MHDPRTRTKVWGLPEGVEGGCVGGGQGGGTRTTVTAKTIKIKLKKN